MRTGENEIGPAGEYSGPENTLEIVAYLHCARCLEERPPGKSPSEWASLEAGWTPRGIQVRCKRHSLNVVHIDFEGAQHPGNTTAKR